MRPHHDGKPGRIEQGVAIGGCVADATPAHRTGASGGRRRDVMGIRIARGSDDLGEDGRPAFNGKIEALEDEDR